MSSLQVTTLLSSTAVREDPVPTAPNTVPNKEDEKPNGEVQRDPVADSAKAQALKEQFEAGVTAGVVRQSAAAAAASSVHVKLQIEAIPDDSRRAIIFAVAGHVQAVLKSPMVQGGIIRAQEHPEEVEQIKTLLSANEAGYTPDERQLCDFLVEQAIVDLKPLLALATDPKLTNAPDEAVRLALKNALQFRASEKEQDHVRTCSQKLKELYPCTLSELLDELREKKQDAIRTAASDADRQQVEVCMKKLYTTAIFLNRAILGQLVEVSNQPVLFTSLKERVQKAENGFTNLEMRAVYTFAGKGLAALHQKCIARMKLVAPPLKTVTDEMVAFVVKDTLVPHIPQFTRDIATLSPAFLQQMKEAMPFDEDVLHHAKLKQKLKELDKALLQQLQEALKGEDKEALKVFFAAHANSPILMEMQEALLLVKEEKVLEAIKKTYVQDIAKLLV